MFNTMTENINLTNIVGFNHNKLPLLTDINNEIIKKNSPYKDIITLNNILSKQEINMLKNFFFENKKINMKNNTIQLSYGQDDNGIERSSFYDKFFAMELSKRVNPFLKQYEDNCYELIGINPLIRFIHYHDSGQCLVPHYDKSVVINDSIITLKTLIIYLNDCNSGYTQFLKDNIDVEKINNNVHCLFRQKPIEGLFIIFNHDVLHESECVLNNDKKLIITTEICYKIT